MSDKFSTHVRVRLFYRAVPGEEGSVPDVEWQPLESEGVGFVSPLGGSLRIVLERSGEDDSPFPTDMSTTTMLARLVDLGRLVLEWDGIRLPLFPTQDRTRLLLPWEHVQPIHTPPKEDVTALICAGEDVICSVRLRRDPRFSCEDSLFRDLSDFEARLRAVSEPSGFLTWHQFHQAIETGEVSLLKLRLPTGETSRPFLSRLGHSLPHLRRVFDQPRYHLKIEEEVRPVGTVRRTGPAALRHIASHTEHWEARTIAGLRPARLLAQVAEDEDALYENRVAVTLAERVLAYLNSLLFDVQQAREQIENALDWQALAEEFGDYRRRKLLELLLPKFGMVGSLQATRDRFEMEEARLRDLLRALMPCFASRLYQSLRRKPRVVSPLRPTNILLMDPHYHALYRLWSQLDAERQRPEVAKEPPRECPAAYFSYCEALLLTGLKHIGFCPVDEDQPIGHIQDGRFHFTGTFQREDWEIEFVEEGHKVIPIGAVPLRRRLLLRRYHTRAFPFPEGFDFPVFPSDWRDTLNIIGRELVVRNRLTPQIIGELRRFGASVTPHDVRGRQQTQAQHQAAQGLARRWREFLETVEEKAKAPDEFTIELLTVLTTLGTTWRDAWMISNGIAGVIPLSTSQSSSASRPPSIGETMVTLAPFSIKTVPLDTTPRILRRLCTHGDNTFPVDATVWGNRKRSCLPVSPYQINSLLRLIYLVQTQTLGRDLEYGYVFSACPVCSYTIHMDNKRNQDIAIDFCRNCGAQWGMHACSCGHRYGFVNSTPSRRRKSMPHVAENVSRYAQWIEFLENESGETVVCRACEAARDDATGLYICPSCGRCPRQDRWEGDCMRCSDNNELEGK